MMASPDDSTIAESRPIVSSRRFFQTMAPAMSQTRPTATRRSRTAKPIGTSELLPTKKLANMRAVAAPAAAGA